MDQKDQKDQMDQKVLLPKPEGHHCFACGTANPIGLNLQFYRLGGRVCADITLMRNHEGWENMAHGGIISTLLDETMAWTILYFQRTFFVTRKMGLKYVRPVLIGIPLTVCAELILPVDREKLRVKGEIRDDGGRLLVRSTGEFVLLAEERLSAVPAGLKKDMRALFDRF